MRLAFIVILIPAVLFASVAPTYAWSAPVAEETGSDLVKDVLGSSDPVVPPNSDGSKGDSSTDPQPPVGERPGERDEPTTAAPPPVGLTPRTDSFEVFERCLRASLGREAALVRFAFSDAWRTPVRQNPPRQELLTRHSRRVSGALRMVAPCVQSNAPPLA